MTSPGRLRIEDRAGELTPLRPARSLFRDRRGSQVVVTCAVACGAFAVAVIAFAAGDARLFGFFLLVAASITLAIAGSSLATKNRRIDRVRRLAASGCAGTATVLEDVPGPLGRQFRIGLEQSRRAVRCLIPPHTGPPVYLNETTVLVFQDDEASDAYVVTEIGFPFDRVPEELLRDPADGHGASRHESRPVGATLPPLDLPAVFRPTTRTASSIRLRWGLWSGVIVLTIFAMLVETHRPPPLILKLTVIPVLLVIWFLVSLRLPSAVRRLRIEDGGVRMVGLAGRFVPWRDIAAVVLGAYHGREASHATDAGIVLPGRLLVQAAISLSASGVDMSDDAFYDAVRDAGIDPDAADPGIGLVTEDGRSPLILEGTHGWHVARALAIVAARQGVHVQFL